MSDILPINLDDLPHARTLESERIESRKTRDPETMGHQVVKTICAFANDPAQPERGMEATDARHAWAWRDLGRVFG